MGFLVALLVLDIVEASSQISVETIGEKSRVDQQEA